ncbi:TetR/AcrR family transcriptional regulator [Oxalobacteraceae sp. CFBP 13730]|nr:TetR/AcrR family transcriptional regulator [Oxalobacteraceae sp. CFBP 13730]
MRVTSNLPEPEPAPTTRKRGGRPSAEHAGEVDRRILDAATTLFLRAGFDATSCDQVVAMAGAGKATLYARYANKDALFSAVVHRALEGAVPAAPNVPNAMPVRERLRAVGLHLLQQALTEESVALLRVCLTTAQRLPELSRMVDQSGRDSGVASIVAVLAGPAQDQAAAATAVAQRFIDLVIVPQQMRALVGDDREQLDAAAPRRVDEAIDLLARAGLLDAFE